ncbi:related to transcription factor 25 [Phialocephala subalpina]|uniref:Related to transcription factor 25 n=1 Tax=Phialocephala subalpina TaxID=576137 RepID=A0A1L7X386_9HELO|nr:related to transcription factor 25 [Phialocephala subalpina]
MSSRQLRKLQQQRELEKAQVQAAAEEEESEDEPVAPTKAKPSLFANLAALEDEDDQGDEPEEDEGDALEEVNEAPAPPSSASKKQKKSKKKKKAKNKGKDKSAERKEAAEDSEDIDKLVRELDLKESKNPASNQATKLKVDPEYERVCALLSIGSQHLKVANEMRALYGKEFADVDSDDDEGNRPGTRGAGRRQRGGQQQVDLETALKGQHKPGQGLSSLTLRRNALIEGKQDWPKATTGGLTMVLDDAKSDDGTIEFMFVHDQQYQTLQQVFWQFVEMGNPQNMISALIKNPYHISLLISIARLAKGQGDHALSSDLLERALFSFGRAATSVFNTKLSQGKARLDFSRPENRELWLAGYLYIKSLIMKGTYRTALEWAKLLLSLDPEGDPYSMRLIIHNLALRAGESKWLLEVGESEIPHIWAPEHAGTIHAASHTAPSLALAAVNLKEGAKARELLSDSMQKLPWLFVRLFKEINLDAPSSIWGNLPRNDAETLFTELYVLQTKDMWNTPEVTALLMEIAHTIPKVNVDNIPRLESREMTLDVVRLLYVDDNPSIMSLAPSYLLHRENNSESDPLPPDVNIYSYEAQRQAIEGHGQGGHGAFRDGYDPIAAIARMIPGFRAVPGGFDVPGGFNEDDEGEDEDDDDDGPADLHRAGEDLARLQAAVEAGEFDDGNRPVPEGLARRLLRMLWWTGNAPDDDDDEDEDEEEQETDDEMPGLIDQNTTGSAAESDDEMPELVDA